MNKHTVKSLFSSSLFKVSPYVTYILKNPAILISSLKQAWMHATFHDDESRHSEY